MYRGFTLLMYWSQRNPSTTNNGDADYGSALVACAGRPWLSLVAWTGMADSLHSGFSPCSPAPVVSVSLCGVSLHGDLVFRLVVAPLVMAASSSPGVSGIHVIDNIGQTASANMDFGCRSNPFLQR